MASDWMGISVKTTDLRQADGNPIPLKWQATLSRLITAGILRAEYHETRFRHVDTNHLSGVMCRTTPLFHDLYVWICRPRADAMEAPFTIADWNNARYIACVCWPDEYYCLID